MTKYPLPIFLLAGIISWAGSACERSQVASPSSASAPPQPITAQQKLTRVVFVGKQNACDCTRKAVDAGWASLQRALGTPAKLPVEQLQIDTEAEKVAPYREQEPIMALPAIYFLNGTAMVVEMLQGEVTEAQIAAVLKK